jgi:predicted kinase
LLARELAVDLVRGHLQRGYDVVVPQYLGRPEFLARLQELAADVGVTFVEVVLTAPAELVGARFRDRRVASAGIEHPESDLPDAAVGAAIDDAVARLSEGAEGRTRIVIDASGDPASTYDELVRALADPT